MKDTNPDHYRIDNADFIKYMDDPKIGGFGNWMHANGYNCGMLEKEQQWQELRETIQELHDENTDKPDVENVTKYLLNFISVLDEGDDTHD